MNGLFPKPGKVGKKDEPKAVWIDERRFIDLAVGGDQL
jgi:hypothetical protein